MILIDVFTLVMLHKTVSNVGHNRGGKDLDPIVLCVGGELGSRDFVNQLCYNRKWRLFELCLL